MRGLAKFLTLPVPQRRDVTEAVFYLGVARLILFLPFRWLVRLVGRPQAVSNDIAVAPATDENATTAVRRAILRVAERLPWQSTCLVRALAARMMLKRRRLPTVLQLGVQTDTATGLSAHAWLKCGEINVVGVESAAKFTPIASFHG